MSSKKTIKSKAVYKYIHCDVFKTSVVIFIGDCDSLRKWANKVFVKECESDIVASINTYCIDTDYSNNNVAARIYDSDSGEFVVHLPKFSFSYNIAEMSNLSHELLHATFLLCDYVGVEYRYKGNNETYTYLLEYFLKEALDKKGYKKA